MAGSGMEASGWGVFSTDVGSVVTAAVVGGTGRLEAEVISAGYN